MVARPQVKEGFQVVLLSLLLTRKKKHRFYLPRGSLAEKPDVFLATSAAEVEEVTGLPENQVMLPAATPTALDSLQDS
jgi:hypothetical protein